MPRTCIRFQAGAGETDCIQCYWIPDTHANTFGTWNDNENTCSSLQHLLYMADRIFAGARTTKGNMEPAIIIPSQDIN